MGSTLSVIVASVGVLDLIYCLAYVSNQVTAGEGEAPTEDGSTNTTTKQQQQPDTGGLEQYREGVRQQIERAQPSAAGGVTYAQDGVPYRDGYRVEHHDELRLDALMAKLRDLERSSQEKDAQLDQMTVQVGELERSSLEQSHIIEELRSRPLSRAASVEPGASSTKAASNVASLRGDLLSVDGVPAIVLNEPTDSGEARPSSSKFRPIRRESELRRSVKRRSVASNASTQEESRLEELEMLSRMEAEEAARVDDDDYTAIEYTRTDYLAAGGDTLNRRHNISPIHELCHLHDGDEADDDDGEREWVPERSPEPTLAGNITKPWGDIRLDEMKKKEKDAVLRLSRSMSIEEEEGVRASDPDEAPGRMIPVVAEEIERSVALPTSRSPTTHSSTPDRSEPTLRRTTKEANLPGLLQLDTATATATAMASPSDSKDELTAAFGDRASPREGSTTPSPSPAVQLLSPVRSVSPQVPATNLEIDAGTEGDTECEDERLLTVPAKRRSKSPRSKSSLAGAGAGAGDTTPRRRYKERKRIARSLTPIDFDQTFMDSFSEQHLSVTPSELEDYINSMETIDFVPPEPIMPSYLYPAKARREGAGEIPSLLLTDDQGTDAQFHDDLSSKSFYGQSQPLAGITLNHRVSYVEWIKKFPDNQTSHLSLEDYDSDDEEVESIIRKAVHEESHKFPIDMPKPSADGGLPQPKPDMVPSPEIPRANVTDPGEFPVDLTPAYATPSPVSQLSDLSELSSSRSSLPSPASSSLALGSPLLNGTLCRSPDNHFTPIPSPSALSDERGLHPTPPPHLPVTDMTTSTTATTTTITTTTTTTTQLRPRLCIPGASRTPSMSPLPVDITPEELVFEIGHLDGLIFEARSREPTPARSPSRSPAPTVPLLSPDELAFDIGNLGGLILGPPSRGASPIPPTSGPSSSLTPSWEMVQPHEQTNLTTNTTGTSPANNDSPNSTNS